MARYFFHRMDGGFEPDFEGTDCSDLAVVRREAVLYAAGTLRDNPDMVWNTGEMQIEVTDDTGRIVTTVTIIAAGALSVSDVVRPIK